VNDDPTTAYETAGAASEQEQVNTLGRLHCCPCSAEQKRRERMWHEFLAFDPFRNSTDHEEYRPS
jgi:hypothetical protein